MPRFNFEKFAGANDRLTTQMKSVGEVMAIGRNQQESLQKALRGLEIGVSGLDPIIDIKAPEAKEKIIRELREPGAHRIWYIADAFRFGMSLDDIFNLTKIDPWFLVQIEDLVKEEQALSVDGFAALDEARVARLKRKGFADKRIAEVLGVSEAEVRKKRYSYNIHPVYKRVDTCAAEFASNTAYMYSSYDEECEAAPSNRDKIMIIGGGPNRIGQGIEFDYCCVHAALALREDGYETIMVNCNPETVSTDYDTSDRLYFEPITLEDMLHNAADHHFFTIANGVDINFNSIIQEVIQQYRRVIGYAYGFIHITAQILLVINDFHCPAAQYIRRAHHHRIPNFRRFGQSFIKAGNSNVFRLL